MRSKLTIAFVALILAAPSVFAQAKQTITGTITDSMCGAHHMMKNATPAQCTRECVKQGSDFALDSGGKIYTLKGDKAQFDKYAGQTVKIKGTIAGSDLTVDSIAPSK